MITENSDITDLQEESNQEVIVNGFFTPSEAYKLAMDTLYSPKDDQFYINKVVSLHEKCIKFPVRIQIEAIEAIQNQVEIIQVEIKGEVFDFRPFDILYIQFSRLIDRKIRVAYYPNIQDYEDSFSYIWEQVYKNLYKYNPTIASPSTFISDIVWKRFISRGRILATEVKHTVEITEFAWESTKVPRSEPDEPLTEEAMDFLLDKISILLTEEQIGLLALRYVDGMKDTEIADLTGITRARIGQKFKDIHKTLTERIVPLVDDFDSLFVDVEY